MSQLVMADAQRDNLFNTMYGGYSGPSGAVLPPPVVLTTSFWDNQKIDSTVTTRYIRSQMPSEQSRTQLDQRIDESEDGLTDSTYLEWIMERAKRLFLILSELGSPEKIFGVVDGSWDDEDLPLSHDSLARMSLGPSLEKKFLKKQRTFLLRDLEPGSHMEYEDEETVPLEVIFKPTARGAPSLEKVYFPRKRDIFYSRKRIPLQTVDTQSSQNPITLETFMEEIEVMKNLSHPHIVSLHASYTHCDCGYLVLSPTVEMNIRTFIQYPPTTYKNLPKERRKLTLIDWLHCLSDALAFLHEEGISHNDIRPSNIIVDPNTSTIYLADIGNTKILEPARAQTQHVESYEYGAPELWVRSMTSHGAPSTATGTITIGRTKRKASHTTTNSDDSPSTSPVERNIHISAWGTARGNIDYEKSDVFSLACIFLDILSFYAKRKHSTFCNHRSAKNRRPRESAPPDASFHANLGQVDTWIGSLEKQAEKKEDSGLANALAVVREMMGRNPAARPGLRKTEEMMYHVVLRLGEELPHCGLHTVVDPGLALFGGWRSSATTESTTSAHSTGDGEHVHDIGPNGHDYFEVVSEKPANERKQLHRFTTSSTSTSKSGRSKRSTTSSVGAIFGLTLAG